MPYPYDPDKARALLREAGVQNLSLKLHFPTGVVSNGPELSQAIAADLARVGIKTEIIQDEWKVFAEKLFDFKNKQANLGDLFLMYYKAGPTIELVMSTVLVTEKNWNWTHYSNPKVDNAWNQAESTVDAAKRTAMFKEMAAVVRDEAPWLFLYEPLPLYGVSNKINWKVRADEFIYVEHMTAR
jgi:peptide/nickel transport system substrate-binding protein